MARPTAVVFSGLQAAVAVGAVLALFELAFTPTLHAETMTGALTSAYRTNPILGGARAALRAADEGVSQANAGFRPQVNADVFLGGAYERGIDVDGPTRGFSPPRAGSLTATQNLFNGDRTVNAVRQAETRVLGSREGVREVEQQVLRDAAAAYMDVLRDSAVLELDASNVAVLREQLRHTRDFNQQGYVTPTDVAQAAAALTLARADYATARAVLQTTVADYRRIVGAPPRRLEASPPVDALLPRSLAEAVRIATIDAPPVVAALHEVDAALLQVELEEGRLYPTIDATVNAQAARDSQGFIGDRISRGDHVLAGGAALRADVPVYSGGATEASIRRAKEFVVQARLRVDSETRRVRARLERDWARHSAARQLIASTRAAIDAAASALSSVRLEANAGKRTTLDVLRAQASLLQARVSLVRAQRDTVVLGYDILADVGWLNPLRLGLGVAPKDPTIHFDQVRDRWSGLRTPDRR